MTSHDNPFISLINLDITGKKEERDSFFDLIRDPIISNRYPTKCDTFKTNRIFFSQLKDAVNKKSPIKFMNHKNNVFLFDHEKIIQIKSNFEAICSYGNTLSYLYYKQNPSELRSLNLGTEDQDSQRAEAPALKKHIEKKGGKYYLDVEHFHLNH